MLNNAKFGIVLGLIAVVVLVVGLKQQRQSVVSGQQVTLAASEHQNPVGEAEAVKAEKQPREEQGIPKLVDLGSDKCIPCIKMKPILDGLGTEYAGKFDVVVINLLKNFRAGTGYGLRLSPTQIFYDGGGTEVYRHEGPMTKDAIRKQLAKLGVK